MTEREELVKAAKDARKTWDEAYKVCYNAYIACDKADDALENYDIVHPDEPEKE
jgi:hypothetical protein